MSFGNKKLDEAYDRWKTASPPEDDEDVDDITDPDDDDMYDSDKDEN